MKKLMLLLMFVTSTAVWAQSGIGVKAGLNYGDQGNLEWQDVSDAGEDIIEEKGDSKMGYHFGLFYRADLGPLFLKPELLYTQTRSTYNFSDIKADYEVSKLDLPILIGLEILGPLNIFAGPSLTYVLDNELSGIELEDVENDFTVGAQIGVGLQLGGLGFDVRYERGLTENEARAIPGIGGDGVRRIDNRPSQIIFSLSLNL